MAAQLKVIGSGSEAPSMDRQKALEAALAQIDRAFGKGSAMKLGSRDKMEIETISSGSLGQNDPRPSCDRRSAARWRNCGVRGRRACARSRLCEEAWCRHRRADRLAA